MVAHEQSALWLCLEPLTWQSAGRAQVLALPLPLHPPGGVIRICTCQSVPPPRRHLLALLDIVWAFLRGGGDLNITVLRFVSHPGEFKPDSHWTISGERLPKLLWLVCCIITT